MGKPKMRLRLGEQDTRTWEALRVLAELCLRRQKRLDLGGELSLHGGRRSES